jgi:DNA-binding transcriptional LysR family regulator
MQQSPERSESNIKPAFEVAHVATAMAMVRHGMGINLIPSSALDWPNTVGLQCIPMAGALAKRDLGVFYRSRKPLSAAANAFIEVLRATVPIDGQARRLA